MLCDRGNPFKPQTRCPRDSGAKLRQKVGDFTERQKKSIELRGSALNRRIRGESRAEFSDSFRRPSLRTRPAKVKTVPAGRLVYTRGFVVAHTLAPLIGRSCMCLEGSSPVTTCVLTQAQGRQRPASGKKRESCFHARRVKY